MATRVRYLDQVHNETDVRVPVLWMFGLTQQHLDILDRTTDPALAFARAIRALADRNYDSAAALLAAAPEHGPWTDADVRLLRSYALQKAGRSQRSQ